MNIGRLNVLLLCITLWSFHFGNAQNEEKVEIALLGTFHFNQVHNAEKPNQNFYGTRLQEQLQELIQNLVAFSPDQIYIEREPHAQPQMDSLYRLFEMGKIKIEELENGAGEVYQIGFRLA